MPDDARFDVAMAVARRLLEQFDARPEAEFPERLSITVYLVLDGIYDSERRMSELKRWAYREFTVEP